ncbi:hypothetical protein ACQY0O_003667 [Thecaphora frezii]
MAAATASRPVTDLPASSTRPAVDPTVDAEAIRSRLFGTPYEPNLALWTADQNRWASLSDAQRQSYYDELRASGLPTLTTGPSVWNGPELQQQTEKWLYTVTDSDKQEVVDALKHFQSLQLSFDDISRATFPLKGAFAKRLEQASEEIHNGIGLVVLRGFEPKQWKREEQIIVYAGIASYIGDERLRQQKDRAIVHLRDLTKFKADERPAITVKGQTNGNQVAHTDTGDVVGLFTLGRAEKGGVSQLSSIGQAYNWFATNRPDILLRLTSPTWEWEGQAPSPLFHHHAGRILAQYARRPWFPFYEDKGRRGNTPELPYDKHVALDAIHFIAEQGFLNIDLQEGDVEFFNNLQVFHARTYSEDSEQNARHLLRIWVRNEEKAVPLPEVLQERWKAIRTDEKLTWPLEAWEKENKQE